MLSLKLSLNSTKYSPTGIFKNFTLPDLSETASKVVEVVTDALQLMDQLEQREPSIDDLFYLIFSELLLPKFNKSAKEAWEKLTLLKGSDDTLPLGHSLTTADLRKVLMDTRTKMQHRELSSKYNKGHSSSAGTAQKAKKNEEKEKERRDTFMGSYQTDLTKKSGVMPKNEEGTCPIPNCGAPLDPKKQKRGVQGHPYIISCPVMKKMSAKDRYNWFKENQCTCLKCFATDHKAKDCNMTKIPPCNEIMKMGENAGKVCGKTTHSRFLHHEVKPGRNVNKSRSHSTKASIEKQADDPPQEETSDPET